MKSANELLPPSLMARLERMELASRKIFRGQLKGERRSKRKGQSVEFADFRTYVPGDDLRLIDWNLYARLDHLFLKLFQEEEDLHVHVVLDVTESMKFGTPSKLRVAKQMAAAIGYVGLCRSDRVRVSALGPLGQMAPVLRGKQSLARLLTYLESIAEVADANAPNTSLFDGVKDFLIRNSSPGVVVLISDLLDKRGYEAALRSLIGRRMDLFVVHLLSPEELDPPIRGDFKLVDAEDGDMTEITLSPYVLQRYRETVDQYMQQARQFCARRGISYLATRSDIPVEELITDYLQKRGVLR